jgi:hypothetical protein
MIAGEVGFPFLREFQQFFHRLALQRFFDFIDAGNGRTDSAHFALVLAADDFLENPLDHERDGVGQDFPPRRRQYTGFLVLASAVVKGALGCVMEGF